VISFESVSYSYGEVAVLADTGFELAPSELAYLVGRSGSGKSTLLRLAHGQLRPRAGRVTVDGVALHSARGRAVRRLRRRVAMVFQDSRLLPRLTALENVTYALRVTDLRLGAAEARRRAVAALCEVGLESRLCAFPRQLSAGQRQRVAAARAVACGPAVLLADEPTASLDGPAADAVLGLFDRLARSGTAVLLATCDDDLAEAGGRRGARVLRLRQGALEEERAEETKRCAAV
jgi:ABC-type ATPase involved in cell division